MKFKLLKILSFVLVLIMLAGLVSCGGGIPPENLANGNEKQNDESDGDGKLLRIVSEDISEFSIVYSERADSDTVNIAQELSYRILEKVGIELPIKSDYVPRLEDISEEKPEILLGLTNRPSSVELNKKIEPLQYAIKITDTKILIAGKSIEALALGVEAFAENYLAGGAAVLKTGEWAIEKNKEFISLPFSNSVRNIMGERLDYTASMTLLGEINAQILGGCVVGESFYTFAKAKNASGYSVSQYGLDNFDLIGSGVELYSCGAGADLDLNAKNTSIMAINTMSDPKTVKWLDESMLTLLKTDETTIDIGAATCFESGDGMAVDKNSGELVFLDRYLNDRGRQEIAVTGVMGMTSDSRFVYILGILDGDTVVAVYTKNGDYINKIKLDLGDKAPVAIESYKGNLLIGFNTAQNKAELYEIKIEVKK